MDSFHCGMNVYSSCLLLVGGTLAIGFKTRDYVKVLQEHGE